MDRMNWLDKLIVAGILILLAALLQGKPKAEEPIAQYTQKNEHVEMVLLNAPCEQPWVKEFVAAARPDYAPRMKRAMGNFRYRSGQWKLHEGCWIELTAEEVGFEAIGTLWDDQTSYLEPKERFTGGKGV